MIFELAICNAAKLYDFRLVHERLGLTLCVCDHHICLLLGIRHDGVGIYRGLPQPFDVGRYHSLILERETLPDCLAVTAETEDGIIMGVRHKEYDVEGVQFHPESILTPEGRTLLGNFLRKL